MTRGPREYSDGLLAARGESPAAFDRRCIPPRGVARRSNTPGILPPPAWRGERLDGLGATRDFHHGLLIIQPPEPSERPTLALARGGAPAGHRSVRTARQAHEFAQLRLFRRRRRRHILVQRPGSRLRDVVRGEGPHDDLLPTAESPGDRDAVPQADFPVRFGPLAVDVNLAALAALLRFGSRLEQTRDVEPDVESESWGWRGPVAHGC